MTTYTSAEFATRVLRDLGLVGAEETPSAADLDFATETAASEVQMLAAKGIQVWNGSETSVPVEYLTLLSRRVGLALASAFGLTDPASATQAMELTERDLRILDTKPATGEVAEAEYF
jgi:hypothetical protein